MSDYDRERWQAEQVERDEAQTAYRDKMTRARERSAANAKRKIARLHAKLTELGHISDFEDEFGESVLERLDKFGSAFNDREKGRAGDALSIAQKQVVARMNKKVKDLKAKKAAGEGQELDPDADYVRTADRWKQKDTSETSRRNGGFKSKRKSKFKPRVRNIEDELDEDNQLSKPAKTRPMNIGRPTLVSISPDDSAEDKAAPYIPEYVPRPEAREPRQSIAAKRPFLRLVPKDS